MVIVFAIMGGIASWRNGGSCARQHSFTVIPCVEQFPHIAYTLASLFRIITALGTRRGANFGLVLFKDKDVCLEFVARSKETLLSFSLGHSTSVSRELLWISSSCNIQVLWAQDGFQRWASGLTSPKCRFSQWRLCFRLTKRSKNLGA